MTDNSDVERPEAVLKARWDRSLEHLPAVLVVEAGSQWTHWLRRELRGLEISVRRRVWPLDVDAHAMQVGVLAWQVGSENYKQVLKAIAYSRGVAPKILQIALVDEPGLSSGYCGLREAGAFHIQSDWYSSRSLKNVLSRYWEKKSDLTNDPMGQVIRRLSLRSH